MDKMKPNDISIEQLNKQEVSAFHTLYKRYYKVVVCYAMQWVESQQVAEDIVQDVFSILWERQLQFASLPAFRTFLYTSVKNASLNHLKHKGVERTYLLSIEETPERMDWEEDDDEFEEEIYRQLFLLIDQLPVRCREIFLLYMEGKKNEEIAEALQISTETVKTQKKRAMQYLKDNMGTYSFLLVAHLLL